MRFEAEVPIFVKHGGLREHGHFSPNSRLCLTLLHKTPFKDYYIPIKTRSLGLKTPKSTSLK